MKKILSLALLLLCSVSLFTACEDDNDGNPTLVQPATFALNEPDYAAGTTDLSATDSLALSWQVPAYTDNGAAVVVTYQVQVSVSGNFTTSTTQAEADESGATVADYAELEDTYTTSAVKVGAADINKALAQLLQYNDEADVPATQDVYIRVQANVQGLYPTMSNTVSFSVKPYYVILEVAPVEMWYLVGSCIGDGSWTNSTAAIGTSIYPMSIVKDYSYNKRTGKGELTFTGYFTTDGFKLIKTPGNWDDQWGSSDGGTTCVMNDGASQNICVPTNGYYTLTLNTLDNTLTVTPATVTPAVYTSMLISGDFNSWSTDTQMQAVNTTASMAGHNHVWSYTIDATAGATTAKFLQPGWSPNWGGEAFPNGIGTENGANIPVSQGKWVVTFNDIDGSYTFSAV